MRVCFLLMCSPFLNAQNPQQDQNKPPEPVKTSVTVTEKISTETPANVSVLDRTSLEQSPGTNLDDRLREGGQVDRFGAGAGPFRRQTSPAEGDLSRAAYR